MSKYLGDVVWPTILLIAIVVPVLMTYMPYISTGSHYDISSSITETLNNAISNPVSLISTYLLGDLAPYLYLVIIAMIVIRRGKIRGLGRELGFSWKPLLGAMTIPLIIALAITWFLISGLLPLIVLPQISLTNILLLVYTLFPIAISEEIVFRGFMLNRLLPKQGNATLLNSVPAIVISAVYFMIAHVPVYLAVYGLNDLLSVVTILAYILLYGIISGFIFVLTRNVIPDIVVHWINDYISIMFILCIGVR